MHYRLVLLGTLLVLPLALVNAFFTDVGPNHPHRDAIEYVQEKGIFQGYSNNTFGSENRMNRAEFTKTIVAFRYSEAEIAACDVAILPFPEIDVPKDAWFTPFICVAYREGLIKGYDDVTFRPANFITFPEGAKIIAEASGADITPGSEWYEGYVRFLEELRAIPISVNTLTDQLTRGQMAEMLYRIGASVTTKSSKTLSELVNAVAAPQGLQQGVPHPVMAKLFANFDVFPDLLITNAKNLSAQNPTKEGRYNVYKKDNMSLFIWERNNTVAQAILLIEGKTTVSGRAMWKNFERSELKDIIVTHVQPGHEGQGIRASDFPEPLATVIQKSYGGQIDLHAGTQAMAELDIRGVLKDVLVSMNYPTNNLVARIGREIPPFNWQTGAKAGVEGSKKNGKPGEAFDPTNYIEILRRGQWENPLGIARMSMTDATVYYDSSNTFGFWGNGVFDGDRFTTYYKGPLIKSKDPRSYIEAQIGFAAEEISMAKYLKLAAAYGSRVPGGEYGFMGEISGTQKEAIKTMFTSIDTLPLSEAKITNDRIKNVVLKTGSKFPGPEVFNLVILGPLAQAKDGTSGPLLRLFGNGVLLGKKTGFIDLTAGLAGINLKADVTAPILAAGDIISLITDGVRCGYNKITDAAKCGLETITSGPKCGFDFSFDAERCGTELITSAEKCGTKVLENAAVCGTKLVTDGPKCGFEFVKSGPRCGFDFITSGPKCGFDFVANAAKCGTKFVTNATDCGSDFVANAAVCGTKTITSAIECGTESFGCYLNPLNWGTCHRAKSCSVAAECNVPRSCSVPKSCNVPRSCNIPKSCNAPKSCNIAKACPVPQECAIPKSCPDPLKPLTCTLAKSCDNLADPKTCEIRDGDTPLGEITGIINFHVDALGITGDISGEFCAFGTCKGVNTGKLIYRSGPPKLCGDLGIGPMKQFLAENASLADNAVCIPL